MIQSVVVCFWKVKNNFVCVDFGFKSTMKAFNRLFLVLLNILASDARVILNYFSLFFIVYIKKSSLAFKLQEWSFEF
jgi:hypothetical protein